MDPRVASLRELSGGLGQHRHGQAIAGLEGGIAIHIHQPQGLRREEFA
jgi:hypothetical protein